MASKKIEFTAKNARAFTTWLKRFASIDNTLLLEIDEKNLLFKAKTYNGEHSCIKFSSINFDEAGFEIKPNKEPKEIRVGLFNVSRLIKVIEQFSAEFTFTVTYDDVTDKTGTNLAGINIVIKSNELKITVDCASHNIFKYMSDEKFTTVIASVDKKVAKFTLTKENIEKINSICNLDNDYKFMQFVSKDEKIYVSGKAFELKINDNGSKDDSKINIFKDQFSKVDLENYQVIMGTDRIVYTSEDSETVTVTSMVDDTE